MAGEGTFPKSPGDIFFSSEANTFNTDIASNTADVGTNTTAIALNTTHRGSDGTNHANVVTNDTHVAGDGSDHADVATNTADIIALVSSPIGTVSAWLKDLTNTPALPSGWVECNGQVISDGDSVYDTVTMPDLNGSSGTQRFLRGDTTSGGTGGSESHTHTITRDTSGGATNQANDVTSTGGAGTLPSYYEVVWIIRIK